jgi:hypothetical protein
MKYAHRIKAATLLLLGLIGCSRPGVVRPEAQAPVLGSPAEAQATLAILQAREPETYKMVHQVVARYQGQDYLMTGYLLGRKDGSFRVSASAVVGPRLFDVAKLKGRWSAQVHLSQLAQQLDPRHVGQAVERIYFISAEQPLYPDNGYWASRSRLSGEEDIDTVVQWRDPKTLATVRKEFFNAGKSVLQIHYDRLELVQGHWLARHVRLEDARGFTLELNVADYQPGFPVPDERLWLEPTPPP